MKKNNYVFYPEGQKGYLRVEVTWNKCRCNFNLGYSINKDKWSKETQRCKKNTFHGKKNVPASEINSEINRYEEIIVSAFVYFDNLKKTPTEQEFKEKFNFLIGKKSKSDENNGTLGKIDEYVNEVSTIHSWSISVLRKWGTIKSHVKRFGKFENLENFTLENFSLYVKFLISENYNNSSTKKEISVIFTFLRWCKKKKYYSGDIIDEFSERLKTAENEIIYLSWEELQKFYNFDLSYNIYLEQARDIFCFQCFTSLRFSDVKALKKDQIHNGKIYVTTKKTNEHLEIELNNYSRAILEKYIGFNTTKALPVTSNNIVNKRLKLIGKAVGLNEKITKVYYRGNERVEETYEKWELLSSHAGRRTFVVNALYLGIPERVVRTWTGHADEKAMKPYVKIVDELKENEMNKFNLLPPLQPPQTT